MERIQESRERERERERERDKICPIDTENERERGQERKGVYVLLCESKSVLCVFFFSSQPQYNRNQQKTGVLLCTSPEERMSVFFVGIFFVGGIGVQKKREGITFFALTRHNNKRPALQKLLSRDCSLFSPPFLPYRQALLQHALLLRGRGNHLKELGLQGSTTDKEAVDVLWVGGGCAHSVP